MMYIGLNSKILRVKKLEIGLELLISTKGCEK